MNRFSGKTVIVTGAGSGIGAATARRFASEGANVVIADVSETALAHVHQGFEPDRTIAIKVDVSRFDEVEAMVAAAAEQFGAIDVMVSNAGIAFKKDFASLTVDDWHRTFAVDLDGVFYCARAVLPHLIKSKGSIIHTASVSGTRADYNMTAYNAAKGAVVNFTRALALDLGIHGIRVNAVCPTLTESGMSKRLLENQPIVAEFHKRIALRRHATPEEIAGPIAFLASDDASFVTGAILPVDGGLSAYNGQPYV